MVDESTRDQIAQLEAQIERLAGIAERCRKFMLASRIGIAIGGAILIALASRMLAFDPAVMVVGITAAIGGIVMLGSNSSTLRQTEAAIQSAEALRAQLITSMNLRLVIDRTDR